MPSRNHSQCGRSSEVMWRQESSSQCLVEGRLTRIHNEAVTTGIHHRRSSYKVQVSRFCWLCQQMMWSNSHHLLWNAPNLMITSRVQSSETLKLVIWSLATVPLEFQLSHGSHKRAHKSCISREKFAGEPGIRLSVRYSWTKFGY